MTRSTMPGMTRWFVAAMPLALVGWFLAYPPERGERSGFAVALSLALLVLATVFLAFGIRGLILNRRAGHSLDEHWGAALMGVVVVSLVGAGASVHYVAMPGGA